MKRGELRGKLDRAAEVERFMAYRVRVLPKQLDLARRKLAGLEREAVRLGMDDLLVAPADRLQ